MPGGDVQSATPGPPTDPVYLNMPAILECINVAWKLNAALFVQELFDILVRTYQESALNTYH